LWKLDENWSGKFILKNLTLLRRLVGAVLLRCSSFNIYPTKTVQGIKKNLSAQQKQNPAYRTRKKNLGNLIFF
jgi:hypothetical protein